jgi:hypothetical protein
MDASHDCQAPSTKRRVVSWKRTFASARGERGANHFTRSDRRGVRRDSLAAIEKQVVYQGASNPRGAKENCSEALVSAEKYSEAFFPPAVTRDAALARAFHHFGETTAGLSLQLAISKCLAECFTSLRNSHHVGKDQRRIVRASRGKATSSNPLRGNLEPARLARG